MTRRPNLTRLLIFLAVLGTAVGGAAAAFGDRDRAAVAAPPPSTARALPAPTAAPIAARPAPKPPGRDCAPGSNGIYIGRHGNVDVVCTLNAAANRWQWSGVGQRDDTYTAARPGTSATDSTGAVWVSRAGGSGTNLWVWSAARNSGWHPPTRPYPAEGVTPTG